MKKILTSLFILLLVFSISGCENPNEGVWDNLEGGNVGDITNNSDFDLDSIPSLDNEDVNFEVNEEGSKQIYLDELSTTTLNIGDEGTYVLSGNFTGNVVVDGDAEKIVIILDNATIKPLDSQPYPAITFKKHSGSRILHIKEGTENFLSDSIGDTVEADEGNAVIQAKKSSLIINGSGILNITSLGEETTGIKVKNNLTIQDTIININVNDNGIKSGEQMIIENANIDITAGNDGMKTDVEATSSEEGDEFTKNSFAGYMYIKNSNITIVTDDNGIDANSYLRIENTSEHTIDITTNNGAPDNITEYSSDNADGKAIRTSGITLVDEETGDETDLLSQTENNYLLVILGGNFYIDSNDDAITSKGNIYIMDGYFSLSSGDDAIHAEYLTSIYGGDIIINKSYEGIEGACVEIYDGTIDIVSTDDGINAANADLTNFSYYIYIDGGEITIDANGDGIDSNGTVQINNGFIVIWGPTNGANAALDADRGILVKGGYLVAMGPAGMVETPASNSTQCSVVYNLSNKVSIGSEIIVEDKDGNILYQTITTKTIQSLVISLNTFEKGKTYSITVGNNTEEITLNSILNRIGNTFAPGGGMKPGGRP